MIKPTALKRGHYECKSLDDTLPVLTDLLAFDIVRQGDGQAAVKHPNTDWELVVHEGAPEAVDKPHLHHYGVRVETLEEVNAAYDYLQSQKERYKLMRVSRPHENHFAHSVYFREPGGNDWEIEYYDHEAVVRGQRNAINPWGEKKLTEERFPGRGYLPQALSHGTRECDDKAVSAKFYSDVLGLEILGGGRMSVYIKHFDTPWYVVVLPGRKRHYVSSLNRFTLEVESEQEVVDAHRAFRTSGRDIGIGEVRDLQEDDGEVSFVFSDLDQNWWDICATR
ncbi:MAG: VOC family protein [Deltaproteobacteria bacterium]|nr:VOC family protein [Deltaproteobacteria bacterium]